MKKKITLLNKVKSTHCTYKFNGWKDEKKLSKEELDVVIAWVKGEVTKRQISKSLEMYDTYMAGWLLRGCKQIILKALV